MKKFYALLLASLVLISLAGCGVKEKLQEKAAEKVTETLLEKAGLKDADIDGDKVTIKGESGEEVTFGGTEWPKDELDGQIPEFKDGVVSSMVNTEDAIMIALDEVKKEDALAYLEDIKKDFSEESYDMSSDSGFSYGGKNADGKAIYLQYSDEGGFVISLEKASK